MLALVLLLDAFVAFLVIADGIVRYLDPENHWADRIFRLR